MQIVVCDGEFADSFYVHIHYMLGYYPEIVKNYKSQSSADKSQLMTGFYGNGLV